MTMTIKLAPDMEQQLRRRSASQGRAASALIREALAMYLAASAHEEASAYALGIEVFGRHRGPKNLAASRKIALADLWTEKHAARG